MLGIPCPFILGGDDAVISGGNDGSSERGTIQFLDVDHIPTIFCVGCQLA